MQNLEHDHAGWRLVERGVPREPVKTRVVLPGTLSVSITAAKLALGVTSLSSRSWGGLPTSNHRSACI